MIEPPNDKRIYNRRQPDGLFRPLDEFFLGRPGYEAVTIFIPRLGAPLVTGKVSDEDMPLFRYAINAYGFLIPFYEITTCGRFAELIKEAYSLDEPHNLEVYNLLIRMDGEK